MDGPDSPGTTDLLRKSFESTELFVYYSMLEDLFGPEDAAAGSSMKREVWEHLRPELLEKVLLFLPAAVQARFCCVCKWWKELMTSSAFQDLSAAIAFHSGKNLLCICNVEEPCYTAEPCYMPYPGNAPLSFKVQRFSLAVIPPELRQFDQVAHWSNHGGLSAMAMEKDEEDFKGLRVCVFSVVDKTWRELPRLRYAKVPVVHWEFKLVAYNKGRDRGFQVFVACEHVDGGRGRVTMYVYSSGTDAWSSGPLHILEDDSAEFALWSYVVGKGGSVYARAVFADSREKVVRMTTDGTHVCNLPSLPRATAQGAWMINASCDDSDTLFIVASSCSIFKCGLGGRKWETVAKLPADIRAKLGCCSISDCELLHAQVMDDVILIAVQIQKGPKYILAYHIGKDSWKWVAQLTVLWEHYHFLAPRPNCR